MGRERERERQREIRRERLTVERFGNGGLLGVVGVIVGDSCPCCLWPALGGGEGRWRWQEGFLVVNEI
jgi:hypothetical protein